MEANADSAGEEEVVSVPEVSKVMEVMEVGEVVPWKERAMVECMYASPSASHVWAAKATGPEVHMAGELTDAVWG